MKHLKTFEWYNQQRMNSGSVKYIDSAVKYDWNYSPEIKPKEKVEDEEEEEEEEELQEKIMGKFQKTIEVDYDIDKTQHAQNRQHRDNNFISDHDIKELIDRSIGILTNALMFDEINIGDKIHLKDRHSDLNIVVGIEEDYNNIVIKIITLMKTEKFKTDPETKTIII